MKKDLTRVDRLIKILQAIDAGNIGRLELTERFEVSERQIYRDINDLNLNGFPIEYCKKTGVFGFQEGYSLKKIAVSQDELQAILLSKEMLSGIGGGLAKSMDTFINRLLTETRHSTQQTQTVSITSTPSIDFHKIELQYNELRQAIVEDRQVLIDHTASNSEALSREIDPYRLFYSDGFWYILGYCHMREDIRTFALDRISKVTILDKHFAVRRDFDFEGYMAGSWKQFSLGEPEEITIHFSKEVAELIKRKKWHRSQMIEDNPDGSINFSATVSGFEEIMRWVLSWGPLAEVISPEAFRQKIKEHISGIIKVYEEGESKI